MPSVWIEIEDEAQDAARRVVSNAYDPDEWCEPDSIRQDIKDLTEKVDSIYEAVNSMARLSARHKQLTDTLEERIIILEEYHDK